MREPHFWQYMISRHYNQPMPPPTNLRRIRREMNRRLLGLVLFVLVIVGGGLIALLFGPPAGALALLCLLAGAALIGLLWLVFTLLGKWAGEE
jgi:protein-S-isoprenylcysteine O-methyltransferase Ste14